MKELKLFFSWQSDNNKTKKIISDAINKAVHNIKVHHGYSIVIEESTSNVPGTPQIVSTILDKIDSCDIFLADVTPVCSYSKAQGNGQTNNKQVPNPNVLMELGYAMSAVGMDYSICVAHQGQWNPNELPFDINHNRIYQFTSSNCDLYDSILQVINHIKKHGRHRHKTTPYLIHRFKLFEDSIKDKYFEKKKRTEEYAFDAPIIYFCQRMSETFHGKRGLVTYSKPKDIKRCLESLFKQPLKLNKTDNNTYFHTFWWFRGPDAAPVEKFKHLGGRRFLIDIMELKIRKIIAYVDPFGKYYGQYVYIEADAEKPTGLYPEHTSEYIEHWRKEWGYYSEEYGIFKLSFFFNKNVTRNEYDDGNTSFMGKTISPTSQNQELRMRFLTPYNLIITSQQSSYNTNKFYNSDEYLNQLLQKKITFEEFHNYLNRFPKPLGLYD